MIEVPLQPIASQTVKTVLADQNFQILLQQKPQGLLVDVAVDGVDIGLSTLALNGVPLAPRNYAGLVGNLIIIDTQGFLPPSYEGLGSRWRMVYLEADEYAQLR